MMDRLTKTANANLKLSNRRVFIRFAFVLMGMVVIIVFQDFLHARLEDTGFYFSESILFSSFWWLFPPILFAQYLAFQMGMDKKTTVLLSLLIAPPLIHLLLFPSIVWIISRVVFYHTFPFQQTLRYTVSEHLYLLLFFYSIAFCGFRYYFRTPVKGGSIKPPETDAAIGSIDSLLVSEGNKQYRIAIGEVLYFSANSPYINLHLADRKYLLKESLKSLLTKLDSSLFVRIHKSTVINIHMVSSYHSRFNGDYDLTMNNGVRLRVSRNYARNFKQNYKATHQVT